jgi:AAA+ ATPase superfamily predicted ATPase
MRQNDESTCIIGRKKELKVLERFYHSPSAEFLAVYGRRRIGKTFLVRNYFKNKGIFFILTGAFNASKGEQLLNFHREFCALFLQEEYLKPPKNWLEAFHRLHDAVKKIRTEQKIILFFDELPWLAQPKSDFLKAIDYYWNQHFSWMSNVRLIVCGSAAAWMVHQILNDKGGLYGRLSAHMRLLPFTLSETEEYLESRNIHLTRQQICEIYMTTGGVPKYLSFLEGGHSAAQCIQNLCFTPQSPLLTEFHKLYHSLFRHPEAHIEIVKTLAKRHHGMLRKELLKEAKVSNSGRTQIILNELLESGFLMMVPEVGKQAREARYYLNDEYSLFYLTWIEPVKSTLLQGMESDYWIKRQNSQSFRIWAGYAFETICLKHVNKIKSALEIGGVSTANGYWQSTVDGKKEIEVDLVIDRADNCINLCEIKFQNEPFEMQKSYAIELQRKKDLFKKRTNTSKALFTTLITSHGAVKNPAYLSVVDHQISVEQLF